MEVMGSIQNSEFRIQNSGDRSQEPGARSGEFSVRRSAFSDGGASAKERSGFQRSPFFNRARRYRYRLPFSDGGAYRRRGVLAFVFRVLVVVFVFPKLRLSRGFPLHSRL
jgi:hypothetical protein